MLTTQGLIFASHGDGGKCQAVGGYKTKWAREKPAPALQQILKKYIARMEAHGQGEDVRCSSHDRDASTAAASVAMLLPNADAFRSYHLRALSTELTTLGASAPQQCFCMLGYATYYVRSIPSTLAHGYFPPIHVAAGSPPSCSFQDTRR